MTGSHSRSCVNFSHILTIVTGSASVWWKSQWKWMRAPMHLSPLPHSSLSTHSCPVPVCIRPDLSERRLGSPKDHVRVGHVEKEELHVDGRGGIFPWLEHTAAFDQHDFLSRRDIQNKNDQTQKKSDRQHLANLMTQLMFKRQNFHNDENCRVPSGKLQVNGGCSWSQNELSKKRSKRTTYRAEE